MTQESPFKLETKPSLAAQVVDRITGMIVGGELSDGDRLPSEADLAEQMGVSRTALREGMRTLEARGLLETRRGIGTVVRSVSADQLVLPLSLFADASGGAVSFEQFHTARSILEVEMAAIAARNATDDDVKQLRRFLEDMEAGVGDADAFATSDAGFHQFVASMTGNPLLELLLAALRRLLEEHIRQVVAYIDPAIDVLPYHTAILRAVEARDPEAARSAMQDHLRQVRENYHMATRGADRGSAR